MSYRLGQALAASACATVLLTSACSSGRPKSQPTESPPIASDVAAFTRHPDDATFEALHYDISAGALTQQAEIAIINRLVQGRVPANVENAIVTDLATVDLIGSIHWLRVINVGSQHNPPPNAANVIQSSSRLSWLFLALRPYGDKSALDFTRMDLRWGLPRDARGFDLAGVNFSNAMLPGGTWQGFDLVGASFADALAAGRLVCQGCTWASDVRTTLVLTDGRWTAPV